MGKILRKCFDLKQTTFLVKPLKRNKYYRKQFFSTQNYPHRAKPKFSDVLTYFLCKLTKNLSKIDSHREAGNYLRKFLFLNEFEKGQVPSPGKRGKRK